jgi:uncharacterized protein YjbI with pentapeptide repeats
VSDARFRNADLTAADFTAAEGSNVDFTGALLDDVKFGLGRQPQKWGTLGLTAVKLRGASTLGTQFPKGWGPSGMPMTRDERNSLCEWVALLAGRG